MSWSSGSTRSLVMVSAPVSWLTFSARWDGDGVNAVRHLGAGAAGGDELIEGVALDDRRELRVLVVGEVARGLVERQAADVRGEDLRIALLLQLGGDEVLQLLAQDGPVGRPEDDALGQRPRRCGKSFSSLPSFAVVAELGLLELHEVVWRVPPWWRRRCRRCAEAACWSRHPGGRRPRWRGA